MIGLCVALYFLVGFGYLLITFLKLAKFGEDRIAVASALLMCPFWPGFLLWQLL